MAETVKRPINELKTLFRRSVEEYEEIMLRLARAAATENGRMREALVERLANLISASQATADLLGRRRLLLEVDATMSGKLNLAARMATPGHVILYQEIATGPATVVPRVSFAEAIEDLLKRDPRLAESAEEVRDVYSEEHGFALARSADLNITENVQQTIARGLRDGVPRESIIRQITLDGRFSVKPFTRAYSQTVYRTNVSTAYSAGRIQMAFKPEVENFALAFEYNAVLDANVRPNHGAADGLIADKRSSIWERFTPPLGYNCRCGIRIVTRIELERRGLLNDDGSVEPFTPPNFSNAAPDPGFGRGRPDRAIYLGLQ